MGLSPSWPEAGLTAVILIGYTYASDAYITVKVLILEAYGNAGGKVRAIE
ncbi:hypothetical protein CE91St32_10040 [Gordonibacter pamelaeae]|nr:hypothetical protein CE91St32_10040 [Gordonibacter pamelaeae]